jgi:RHS repeat-associated protein
MSHDHAVTSLSNGNTYAYDANGNMTSRQVNGQVFNLAYDSDSRLVQVSGTVSETFKYNGDGQRVIGTEGGITTVYIGNYFEWKGSTSTMVRYYYAGAARVAMRTGTADPLWMFGDHLGSTSVVANYDGSLYARQGYYAWGERRFLAGDNPLPTTFRYTGQRESASFGMYYYGARWYDPSLGRFTQVDTIIPLESQGVQAWDRYAYVNNNPIRYNDPSGHGKGDPNERESGPYWSFSEWQFERGKESPCKTRQDCLYSEIFRGSGPNGSWTYSDWKWYYENHDELWKGDLQWRNPDPPGWNTFANHVERLASHYTPAQSDQFIDDFALIFGGVDTTKPWPLAAIGSARHPELPFLPEGLQGLSSEYLDSSKLANQSHHYAAMFWLSYKAGVEFTAGINLGRDFNNSGDINLGDAAAYHAYLYRNNYHSNPAYLYQLILSLIN